MAISLVARADMNTQSLRRPLSRTLIMSFIAPAHPILPACAKSHRGFVVDVEDYVYWVPYVETGEEIFLKTITPSRKATKHHLRGGHD